MPAARTLTVQDLLDQISWTEGQDARNWKVVIETPHMLKGGRHIMGLKEARYNHGSKRLVLRMK